MFEWNVGGDFPLTHTTRVFTALEWKSSHCNLNWDSNCAAIHKGNTRHSVRCCRWPFGADGPPERRTNSDAAAAGFDWREIGSALEAGRGSPPGSRSAAVPGECYEAIGRPCRWAAVANFDCFLLDRRFLDNSWRGTTTHRPTLQPQKQGCRPKIHLPHLQRRTNKNRKLIKRNSRRQTNYQQKM